MRVCHNYFLSWLELEVPSRISLPFLNLPRYRTLSTDPTEDVHGIVEWSKWDIRGSAHEASGLYLPRFTNLLAEIIHWECPLGLFWWSKMFIHTESDETTRQSTPLNSQCSLKLKCSEILHLTSMTSNVAFNRTGIYFKLSKKSNDWQCSNSVLRSGLTYRRIHRCNRCPTIYLPLDLSYRFLRSRCLGSIVYAQERHKCLRRLQAVTR